MGIIVKIVGRFEALLLNVAVGLLVFFAERRLNKRLKKQGRAAVSSNRATEAVVEHL